MAKTSVLQLEWKRREGGGGKTQRDYLDFAVNGQPLSEKLGGDLASCLGWFVPEENTKAIRRLLLFMQKIKHERKNKCHLSA